MKKFFCKQWLNFKKNWYWYILGFFVFSLFWRFIECGMIYFCLYFNYNAIIGLGDVSFYSSLCSSLYYLPVSFCFFYFGFRLNDLFLYIFSYYIHTGKNNWYKFSRERNKQHNKEDKIAYKEYLKQNKKED